MKRAAFLERKVLRMWVGGKGRRGGEEEGREETEGREKGSRAAWAL